MTTTIYGIPNCDSVKKARKWLDSREIRHVFLDFRKTPVEGKRLHTWFDHIGAEKLVNRRSTTWKSLSEADRARVDAGDGPGLLADNVTLTKRPVLAPATIIVVGFSEAAYAGLYHQ